MQEPLAGTASSAVALASSSSAKAMSRAVVSLSGVPLARRRARAALSRKSAGLSVLEGGLLARGIAMIRNFGLHILGKSTSQQAGEHIKCACLRFRS